MSNKSTSRNSITRSSSSKSIEKTTQKNSSTIEDIPTLLRANVPRLSTPLSEEELMALEIKPRELANVALMNNGQNMMDLFLTNDNVLNVFKKIEGYNSRETSVLSFEFFLVKLKNEYFYFYLDGGEPKVLALNTRATESKFVVLLDKLDSVFKTSGFRICSSILSKDYINYCLQKLSACLNLRNHLL